MSKDRKSGRYNSDDTPRDSKRGHRARSQTIARKRERAAKQRLRGERGR